MYYWRVSAKDALGNWGDPSAPFSFSVTFMLTPKDGSTTTNLKPIFSWAAVSGAVEYHFELSEDDDFDPLWGMNTLVRRAVCSRLSTLIRARTTGACGSIRATAWL